MVQSKKPTIQSLEGEHETSLFFAPVLARLLAQLPERSRDIVIARYGVSGTQPKTLEEIGQTYGITRERVRQIIGGAMKFLRNECEGTACAQVIARIKETLEAKSGIMKAEDLLQVLASQGGKERGALLVFIECLPMVVTEKMSADNEEVYMLKGFSLSEWKQWKEAAKKTLETVGHALEAEALYARLKETKKEPIEKQKLLDFLSVAKDVCQSVFGKWGLASWSDIKPRGTREKAYLVLKTVGKPLHFREIAALIDRHGLQNSKKRASHPQTVHNELIKDNRFVLVGRGVYALAEWGYERGTVKDVLEGILRKANKPLSRAQILDAVLKVRQVKKSTVIINLNTFFNRVGKDVYSIRQ